jgi:hypothetical protein
MIQFTYRIEASDTRITFPAKPSEAIRALLKGAGFRWSPSGYWWRRGCKGGADFITALDRRLNPRPDGACWRCQAPNGFFRPQGAATPVYCDACYKELTKPEHTCAGMHDISCDACHEDRFDLDYEDRCKEACGL